MGYNQNLQWTKLYQEQLEMAFPAEGVIRILKGSFPELKLPKPLSGKILDMGCGDGRHFPLFQQLRLLAYGTEICDEICRGLVDRLNCINVDYEDIKVGMANSLPFDDAYFDYMLAWNSCYYMASGLTLDMGLHINEMARVLKKNAWLICSIPKKTSFIFKDSLPAMVNGYRIIANDPWGARNGQIMRCYDSKEEITSEFGVRFTDYSHADIEMDWFGLNYSWHVFVARKK